MKIGIISDTHDHREYAKKTVDIFNNENCSLIIHSGDFVAPFIINDLMNLKCPMIGVFGNNDGERKGLKSSISLIGEVWEAPLRFSINEINFLILHEPVEIDKLIEEGKNRIIIYGHTHRKDLRKEKNVLIINPGEAGGWLYGSSSIAILNLEHMSVDFIDIK
ncbi:MAG: metallophosphoesterase [Acidobacteriota bacterium]